MFIPDALYREITRVMPISCVDLLVVDDRGYVLLVRRHNEPAKGQWWLPGGRVHFGETRAAAALRKLHEECGLDALAGEPEELLTADIILSDGQGGTSHAISTVFLIIVTDHAKLHLDQQSVEAAWRQPRVWLAENLDPFVTQVLTRKFQD